MDLEIRQITRDEIEQIHQLEAESYPDDEAASFDMFLYRWKEAPDLLLAAFHDQELIGFVCGTRYHGDTITNECMKMHIPHGKSVCIHSVVVKSMYRRRGIALQLLDSYIRTMDSEQSDVTHILLICKSNLIPLYTRAGFILRGKSEVVYGKDPWYELALPCNGANG